MDTQIICPSCKKPIPLTEALSHEAEEKYRRLQEEKINQIRQEARKWKEEQEKNKQKELQEKEEVLRHQLQEKINLKLKDTENAKEEAIKKKDELLQQVLELTKSIRQMKEHDKEREIEMQRKLSQEQEIIKRKAKEQADEEYGLKLEERDKKLRDAQKMVEDYKRKLEQGSQQAQGEVLELHVGEMLRREFPLDIIEDVPKGKFGADLIQKVMNRKGQECGIIVWELKRTKSWMSDWIPKLKEDQRQVKAVHAAIISEVLPTDIKTFGFKDGVWVGNYQCISGLAFALRRSIIAVFGEKNSSIGKKEKMEVLWEYLKSTEFTQRVQSIMEVFSSMEDDIQIEQTWFQRKWEKQRKNIRRVIDNTAGMYGSLDSIMGKALPEVSGLSLPEELDSSAEQEDEGALF